MRRAPPPSSRATTCSYPSRRRSRRPIFSCAQVRRSGASRWISSPRNGRSPISPPTDTRMDLRVSPTSNPRAVSWRVSSRRFLSKTRRLPLQSTRLAVLTGQPPETLDSEFGEEGRASRTPGAGSRGRSIDARAPPAGHPEFGGRPACSHRADRRVRRLAVSGCVARGQLRLAQSRHAVSFRLAESFLYVRSDHLGADLHGGALVASVRLSRAQAAEAALAYRKTVLGALQEVEDGLSALYKRTGSGRPRSRRPSLPTSAHSRWSSMPTITVSFPTSAL